MEGFVWSTILDILRDQYAAENVEDRKFIKTVFKEKLKNLETTALRGVQQHSEKYEQGIGPYLLSWQENLSDYVPKLLVWRVS